MRKLKLLGVHGLGDHRTSTWKEDWQVPANPGARLDTPPGRMLGASPRRV